jgi:hypothetical protein
MPLAISPINPLTNPLEAMQQMADRNGTVPYTVAHDVAETLCLDTCFISHYGEMSEFPNGVDVGEFVAWALELIGL